MKGLFSMTINSETPVEETSVFSDLSKTNTGKWAQRYLLNPDDVSVSDVKWIWEEVFNEGTVTTVEEAHNAARLLFEEFGGHDQSGRPITRGVFLFLKKFVSEELATEATSLLT
jgi:hypothetical protein